MTDRLISADDLIEKAYRLKLDERELVTQMILSAPTVDAVPVIRCKDCRWYYQLWIDRGIMREHCRRVHGVVVNAGGYCAWGKRREDNA